MKSISGVLAIVCGTSLVSAGAAFAQSTTVPAAGWYSVSGAVTKVTCNGKDQTGSPLQQVNGQLYFPGAGGAGMALYQPIVITGGVILPGNDAGESVTGFSRVSATPLSGWKGTETLNDYGGAPVIVRAAKTTFSASIQPFDVNSFELQLTETSVSTIGTILPGSGTKEICVSIRQFAAIRSGAH